ncbi:MAG: glycosyl hydrolase-related protein [Oscillospiraceae bacterium]|nr:glycosyl hydrolase-related protein [Oscillospiraceae bacterium]
MALFDVMPFKDKNSERFMYSKRIGHLLGMLQSKYLITDSKALGGFEYRDGQYSIADKDEGTWAPFNHETDWWGYPECYCWFRHSFTIPERFKGKTVFYQVYPYDDGNWAQTNPQLIFFANGHCVQGMDSNHQSVKLLQSAQGGEKYDVHLNAHTDTFTWRGQVRMRARLNVIDEDVYKLLYHIRTPLEVANLHGIDDLARVEIIKTLTEAINMLNLNAPYGDAFKQNVFDTIAFLDENLYGKDTTGVTVSSIGHTHIDVAWLWRLRQTRDKTGRTFATVLKMMEENPDYQFMSSQAQLYDYVKKDYPEVYEGMRRRIREGRWEVEGGMWVEADTNVSSGESLVRQFLVGKRFFRKEFDKDCKILWLPDVFGYSASLPQIMKKSGIDYFMTTKISWSEYTKLPYDTFMWRGIDGSEVLSHFIPSQDYKTEDEGRNTTTYNGHLEPKQVMGGWYRYQQKDLNKNILFSYGWGDGGGGPTQHMFEHGKRMEAGIQGCPKVKFETAREFFDRLDAEVKGSRRLNTWCGELYLEYHRGTLTAQASNKRYNRKSEVLYQDAETASVLAATVKDGGFDKYPKTGLDNGWEIILLNQFHDIIPGSSIKAVYDDSKEQYEAITTEGKYMLTSAFDRVAADIKAAGRSLVVFNTLGFARTEAVICDPPASSAFTLVDADGSAVPYQATHDGKIIFVAEAVPSKGYKTYLVQPIAYENKNTAAVVNGNKITSRHFDFEFDGDMAIAKLIHKKTGRSVAPEGKKLNEIVAYEDRPYAHPAWDVNAYFEEKESPINDVQSTTVIENGPVRTVIQITRRFQSSLFTQNIIVYNDIERIDVENVVDWKEDYYIVKALFPVDVNAVKATYDIQFGNLERSAHRNTIWDFAQFEVAAQKWADVSDNSFGLSVLNDCKYGYDIKNNLLRLTLIRCQNSPQPDQDKCMHYFTYSIYPHGGHVAQSDVVSQGYSLNYPLYTTITEGMGELPAEFSLFSVDKDNIVIETVKKCEDSDEIIVRVFETWNRQTACAFTSAKTIAAAAECDMMEENDAPLTYPIDNVLDLTFKPFEIKTLKLRLK